MIQIHRSPTADTRTCDFAHVSKGMLYESSCQHISDVCEALNFFQSKIVEAAFKHDPDKLTDIDGFHADFVTGFKETGWWDRHRKLNRHHLTQDDGIPADVNLIDVLDFIADCVMAGMARSGSVYPLKLSPELLERAFQNTVELLKSQVEVVPDDAALERTRHEEAVGRQVALEDAIDPEDELHGNSRLIAEKAASLRADLLRVREERDRLIAYARHKGTCPLSTTYKEQEIYHHENHDSTPMSEPHPECNDEWCLLWGHAGKDGKPLCSCELEAALTEARRQKGEDA